MTGMFRKTLITGLGLVLAMAICGSCLAKSTDDLKVRLDRVTLDARDTQLLNVFVSVTNAQGRAIKNLDSFQFSLFADGELWPGPTRTESLVVTNRPLAYAILLDNGEEAVVSFSEVRNTVADFIVEMGFQNPGAVLSYNGRPRMVGEDSSDTQKLAESVRNLAPEPGRPLLYDGIPAGLGALSDINREYGVGLNRRALIVLTDGRDLGSLSTLEKAAEKVQASGAVLFVVEYGAGPIQVMDYLANLASATGGASFPADSPGGLGAAMMDVADRLKYQYVLTGVTDLEQIADRSLSLAVQVDHGGLRATGRRGFMGPQISKSSFTLTGGYVAALVLILLVCVIRKLKPMVFWPRPERSANS